MKLIAYKLLILFVAVSLAMILAEFLVRMAVPQPPSWLSVYRRHPHLPLYTLDVNVQSSVSTGESEWTVHTDSHGFRVSSVPDVEPDLPVALALGDSFAFGQGVNYEQSFVGRLNGMGGRKIRYINAAVGGYGPTQYWNVLKYLLDDGLSPNRVMVAVYLGNDFYDCIWNKNQTVVDGILGNRRGFRSFVKRNSHLYRLISRIYHVTVKSERNTTALQLRLYDPNAWKEEDLSKAYSIFRDDFKKISDFCRAREIPLLVCVIPTVDSVRAAGRVTQDGGEQERPHYDLPSLKARTVFTDLGIPFLDVTAKLAQHGTEDIYFRHDGHLTPLGNQIVAQTIRDYGAGAKEDW